MYGIRGLLPNYKNIVIHGFVLTRTDVYHAVSKKLATRLLGKLEDANQELIKRGPYKGIAEKWGMVL